MKITIDKEKTREIVLFCMLGISICVLPYIHNTLYKILILVASGIMMLYSSGKKKKIIIFSTLNICWALFVIWSYLSSFWSEYAINTDRIIVMAFIGIEIFSFGIYLDSVMKVISFFKGIIFGALVLVIELFLFYGVDGITSRRFSNEILNSNHAGVIFAIAAILSVFIFVIEKGKQYLVFSAVLIFMTTLSGSRTAILAFSVSFIVFMIVRNSTTINGVIKGIFIGVLFGGCISVLIIQIPVLYNIIGERLIETFALLFGKAKIVSGYNSNYLRLQEYIWAFQLIKEHPILGVGLDNYRHYNQYNLYAHCNYLEIWSNLGVIGFGLYYIPFFSIFSKLKYRKKNRNWEAMIIAYIFFYLIINVTAVIYYRIFDITIMACFYYLVINEKIDLYQGGTSTRSGT